MSLHQPPELGSTSLESEFFIPIPMLFRKELSFNPYFKVVRILTNSKFGILNSIGILIKYLMFSLLRDFADEEERHRE